MKEMIRQRHLCKTPPNTLEEVDVPSRGRISISLQVADSLSLNLTRSDDKPRIGVMCGGEEQTRHTWQEELQGKLLAGRRDPPINADFLQRSAVNYKLTYLFTRHFQQYEVSKW